MARGSLYGSKWLGARPEGEPGRELEFYAYMEQKKGKELGVHITMDTYRI